MTQHIEHFLNTTTIITADGSLVPVEELESLYIYWCSQTGSASTETSDILAVLAEHGVDPVTQDGVPYVEGLVLSGSVVADFILSCDFAGAWGAPFAPEFASVREVATAS